MAFQKRPERIMFYGASPNIFANAKSLRENMTETEKLLWQYLRNKQIEGLRFKSQHPIGRYIADFYCHKAKLVIEVDGGYHNKSEQKEYDENRNSIMESYGIKVIRFTNDEIINKINWVIEFIKTQTKLLTGKNNSEDINTPPLGGRGA